MPAHWCSGAATLQGNGTTGLYEGDVGYRRYEPLWRSPIGGRRRKLRSERGQPLQEFTGSCATLTKGAFKGETACTNGIPNFYGTDDLKATLSNNSGFAGLLAKYKMGPGDALRRLAVVAADRIPVTTF